jgi:hypothetical protein
MVDFTKEAPLPYYLKKKPKKFIHMTCVLELSLPDSYFGNNYQIHFFQGDLMINLHYTLICIELSDKTYNVLNSVLICLNCSLKVSRKNLTQTCVLNVIDNNVLVNKD